MWVYLAIIKKKRRRASTKTGKFYTRHLSEDGGDNDWINYKPSSLELSIAKLRASEKGVEWMPDMDEVVVNHDNPKPNGHNANPWAQSKKTSPRKKIPIQHQKII